MKELDEIEARADAATEEPWACMIKSVTKNLRGKWQPLGPETSQNKAKKNMDFIAHSRTDIPKLVKALRRLLAEIERSTDKN